jgi:hypothetical protein
MKDMYIKETKQLHKSTSDERTKGRLNMATLTMMATSYTELLMMGLQIMQYIMLLVLQITYSKEFRTTVKTI